MAGMDPTPAIEALRASTEAGFRDLRSDLTSRLDQAVTRREHDAEVRRIDSERQALSDALVQHAKTSEDTHVDIDKRLVGLDARMTPLERQVAKWAGLGIAGSVVLSAAIAIIAALIQKG